MNIFVDVGAGRGEIFTLDDVVPPDYRPDTKLFCIEPSARNFVHLMEAAKAHAAEWKEVALANVALTGSFGLETLHLKTDHSGDSLHKEWVTNEQLPFDVGIGCVPAHRILEGVSESFRPYHRLTLKLDCEGEESIILTSLLEIDRFLRMKPRILVEWHDADPDCRQYLEQTYKQRGIELELWNH